MATYRFAGFSLDTKEYRLWRGDQTISLPRRQFDLLAYLAERSMRVVTRDEMFRDLWKGVIVTENALTQMVSDLRRALDDSAAAPRFIETVAGRGYRFIAPVEVIESQPADVKRTTEGQLVQTSNLEVLRSVFDGRLKLESLGA